MENMNGYENKMGYEKEKASFLLRKRTVKNGEECSFFVHRKLEACKTLPVARAPEGIHNRRSFQEHICSAGDLYPSIYGIASLCSQEESPFR